MKEPINYTYIFKFSEENILEFDISLDHDTLALISTTPEHYPYWTKLEFEQCSNCSLSPDDTLCCPVAVNMITVVERFSEMLSIENTDIEIATCERNFTIRTKVTRGLSSLIGIIMVTSGCPILDKLRPMVRFHLPFATIEETTYRSASTYLLSQYYRMISGKQPDWELEKLKKIYREIHVVNRCFARRISNASTEDANINAISVLDIFTESIPISIENRLSELQHLFFPYLSDED